MVQSDAERAGVSIEETPAVIEELEPVVEDPKETEEGIEETGAEPAQATSSEGGLDPEARKYIDEKFDLLASVLAKGNQSQADKLLDRISKVVQRVIPSDFDDPATEVLVTYWEAKGGKRENMPDTSKAANPNEAFTMLTKAARRLAVTKPVVEAPTAPSTTVVNPGPGTTPTKPIVTTATKTVPPKAGRGVRPDTREILRDLMASGGIDFQQYMDRAKKIGYDPLH